MGDSLGLATSATNYFLEVNRITIDNWTFKLFYKWTPAILLIGAGITLTKQFVYEGPIHCEVVKTNLTLFVKRGLFMLLALSVPIFNKKSRSKQAGEYLKL